jgi:hypothetical protein
MKKSVLVLFALVICFSALGQRHIKGVKALELNGGFSKYGNVGSIGFVRYMSLKTYLKGNVYYAMDSNEGIKHNSIGLDVSFLYSFPVYKNIVYANLQAGLTVANDRLTAMESGDDHAAFKFGGLAGVEVETYLSNKFSIILNGNERFISQQLFGTQRWYGTIGIRYHLIR